MSDNIFPLSFVVRTMSHESLLLSLREEEPRKSVVKYHFYDGKLFYVLEKMLLYRQNLPTRLEQILLIRQ